MMKRDSGKGWRIWRLRSLALALLALMGGSMALGAFGAGCSDGDCQSTRQYFAQQAWPVLERQCIGCHNAQGAAGETEYVLKGSAETGFLDANLETIRNLALLERDGTSQFLLKPSAQTSHGGGEVIAEGSDDYDVLAELVERLQNGDDCEADVTDSYEEVERLSAEDTLRKASIILLGRLPLDNEKERVQQGGEAALAVVLDEMMGDEAFIRFVKQVYGDLLGTDEYLNNASDQLDDGYANPRWYETAGKDLLNQYGLTEPNEVERYTDLGLAREPLEYVAHVVRNNRPFSEIVTANYQLVTPFTARSYGAVGMEFTKDNDPLEYAEARRYEIDADSGDEIDFPHAGILSNKIFLRVYDSTPTNRNRARARVIYEFFLGTDILKTAEQPLDQSEAERISLNPTREAPMCTVCHGQIDPLAGTLQAFDNQGDWDPSLEWYPEMYPPGFGKEKLPLAEFSTGVQWLAGEIAKDDRFALAAVFNMYHGLTGQQPQTPPSDLDDPLYGAKFNAFLAQSEVFRKIAENYRNQGENLKVIVKELVLSPYFRASNSTSLDAKQQASLAEVGMGLLLTPEQLHAKISAVLGMPWVDGGRRAMLTNRPRDPANQGTFQMFYGGIAPPQVTSRIREPNGLMASVMERMALQMSCYAVPQDFVRPEAERLLFPFVEVDGTAFDPLNLAPEDANGIAIPAAQQALKQVMVRLHERLLGETLSVEDPELDRTYTLFLETWREGNAGMAKAEAPLSTRLPYACEADEDPFTGVDYSDDKRLRDDEQYIVRSWMAVVTYLLGDYRFLYE